MSGSRPPGTYGTVLGVEDMDPGTSALCAMPAPGATHVADKVWFESVVQGFEAEIANAGAHLTLDGAARQAYSRQIKAMADELRSQASRGAITWSEAAEQARKARNAAMDLVRGQSTPVGRAIAQQLKSQGRTLNELVAHYTLRLNGPGADFTRLSAAQQHAVYAEIVDAAARSNPRVTSAMRTLSRAGRGLIVLSVGVSVYQVATADDWVDAAGREAAVTGAGVVGGIAGGAMAGLACGPGAPVCVTVGAFVGGALAAMGIDSFW